MEKKTKSYSRIDSNDNNKINNSNSNINSIKNNKKLSKLTPWIEAQWSEIPWLNKEWSFYIVRAWLKNTYSLFKEGFLDPLIKTLNKNKYSYENDKGWFLFEKGNNAKAPLTTFLKRAGYFLVLTLLPFWFASGLNISLLITKIHVLFITIYHLPALFFVLALPHAAVVALSWICIFVFALLLIAAFFTSPHLFRFLAKGFLAVTGFILIFAFAIALLMPALIFKWGYKKHKANTLKIYNDKGNTPPLTMNIPRNNNNNNIIIQNNDNNDNNVTINSQINPNKKEAN